MECTIIAGCLKDKQRHEWLLHINMISYSSRIYLIKAIRRVRRKTYKSA